MRLKKFFVKRANLHSAKPNPFRRSQTLARGKWINMGVYETLPEAVARFNELNKGGFHDLGVFINGKRIVRPHEHLRAAELTFDATLMGFEAGHMQKCNCQAPPPYPGAEGAWGVSLDCDLHGG